MLLFALAECALGGAVLGSTALWRGKSGKLIVTEASGGVSFFFFFFGVK